MEAIIELTRLDFSSLFISLFILLTGIKGALSLLEWLVDKLGLEIKWMRKKREDHELLIKTSQSLLALQEKLTDSQAGILTSIEIMKKEIDERFHLNEEKQNKRIQAEIKDKIAHSYRQYHPAQKISEMELEALEDLITAYESYGGENSFVHSVVEKEMYGWEKI